MKLSNALTCGLLAATFFGPVSPRAASPPPPTAERPAETPFASEIAAFEASDRKSPPLPGGVLFVGSSSIRLWTTLASDFPELPVVNRGFGGSQIADSVRYADRIVIPYKPEMIVFFAGVNDLNAGKSPMQVLLDFQNFVKIVHAALPNTRIVYLSINPTVARWKQEEKTVETNRRIEEFMRGNNSPTEKLSFIDSHARLLGPDGKPQPELLRADGLHLNAEGYKKWTAIVKPRLLEFWKDDKAPTLGVEQGTLIFDTPDFALTLLKSSQTVSALQPKGGQGFDFTPADRLSVRSADGFYQLGDLTFRARVGVGNSWNEYSTAAARQPVRALPPAAGELAAADLVPTLPASCPLRVVRVWRLENGRLALRFTLQNTSAQTVHIGALGIPMVFNNILTDRTLAQAHAICSFSDPYIGQDAGYIQVTRLSGHGPTLLVVPDGKTPLEAYRLLDEPMRPSQTFEGMFAWMVHSAAYAENEWKNAEPWNAPTQIALAPGQSRTYGVKFLVSPDIRRIDATLSAARRPLAVGIPGYVLPTDQNGQLFLKYPSKINAVRVEPTGAIQFRVGKTTPGGWKNYALHGRKWGRARVTVTYADGLTQMISYDVIKPEAQAVADLGHFLTTKQWFDDPTDPFHRTPSIISYDREADKQVTQESRVWIAGLGDEGGSGSFVAAAMKEFGQPNAAEVAKYSQFIDKVLWGVIQCKDGPNKYGVRKSVFYYDPKKQPDFAYDPTKDWRSWTSWNKEASEDIGRGYNYPHVVAAYWAMYRVARNHPGMVTAHPWQWYLEQAYQTTHFLFSRDANGNRRVGYVELGLMEGDVFLALLQDLQNEGWAAKASDITVLMRERADRWSHEAYPFGSEMAWDSTGQEEVYAWCKYFGFDDKAKVSLDSILGYMPTLPHWGYNGNARRYWDFLYGGKLPRIERQIHHYGSGLNALPVLAEYRTHPDDDYLLRVGYGGVLGPLTNIDPQGFASVAFHSFPSTLKWDAYSGDYGPNFFGHAMNTATYVIRHPEFGWQAYGGNVETDGDWVKVQPRDSFRTRVYVAPRGLWLTLDAGTFESVAVNRRSHAVRVTLSPATVDTPSAFLRVEQPAKIVGIKNYHPVGRTLSQSRGAYVILTKADTVSVTLNDTP